MISNSGKDENGNYRGGSAGDNNGHEWEIRTWYNRPWDCVLRYSGENTSEVRRYIRNYAIAAAKNDHIGYDQNERYTFWQQLTKCNYNPANITTNCESDCSAGVLAICKAVGYTLGISKLQGIDHTGYTGNMQTILGRAGFTILTDSKYRYGEGYLVEGDILLNIKSHTATYVADGNYNGGGSEPTTDNPYDRIDIKPYESNASVKEMQARLCVLGFYDEALGIDGVYGYGTFNSICAFQDKYNLGADGYASHNGITWKKIDELMEGKHATIKPDWRGKDVYEMAQAMNLFGYRANGIGGAYIVEDGIYGANGTLRKAVEQFQTDYNMGADGIASATGITWRKVDELYNDIEQVTVTASSLNVRRGRGTDTDIIGTIANGTWHKKTNEVGGWAYLHDVGGWVNCLYIK